MTYIPVQLLCDIDACGFTCALLYQLAIYQRITCKASKFYTLQTTTRINYSSFLDFWINRIWSRNWLHWRNYKHYADFSFCWKTSRRQLEKPCVPFIGWSRHTVWQAGMAVVKRWFIDATKPSSSFTTLKELVNRRLNTTDTESFIKSDGILTREIVYLVVISINRGIYTP